MEAISLALRDISCRRPVLVTVDDAQWIDASSLRTLSFVSALVRDAALVIVAAFVPSTDGGSADRVAAASSEILRQPISRLVELTGLSASSVDALVTARRGAPDPTLAAQIFHLTDGNAFLVTQLLNANRNGEPSASIPRTVQAVLETRLRTADADTWRTVQVASVIGREFSVDVLVSTAQRRREDIVAALTFATRAGVIEEADRVGHRFVHSLFRDAVYSSLATSDRGPLHAAAAGALTASAAGEQAPDLARIAGHLAEAAAVDADLVPDAVRATLDAARNAGDQLAWDEAAVLLERAAELAERSTNSGMPVDEVLARLGDARRRAGSLERAMAAFVAAGLRWQDDPERLARIALGHEDAYLASGIERRTSGDPSVELLERAREALSDDAPGSLPVLAALARAHWFSGARDTARELLDDITRTPLVRDEATSIRVLDLRRIMAGHPSRTAERLAVISELFTVAERAGRFEVALDALRARILCWVELARLDDADDDIEHFARLVERWREPHFRPFVGIFRAMRALQAGRFGDAATQIARSELEVIAGPGIPRQLILMQRYALSRWWSQAPEASSSLAEEFRRYTGRTGSAPLWRHTLAQLHVENGDDDMAADLLAVERRRGEHWLAELPMDEFWTMSMCCFSNVLAAIGTSTERADALGRLAPFAGQLVGNVAPLTGPVDQALGTLALSLGRHDVAREHFRAAVELARHLDAQPWQVQALCGAAASSGQLPDSERSRADDIDHRLLAMTARLEMIGTDRTFDADAAPRASRSTTAGLRRRRPGRSVAADITRARGARADHRRPFEP